MSRKIVIDRFEGTYAICEDKDQKFFAIEIAELPQGAKEGMLLKSKTTVLLLLIRRKQTCAAKKIKNCRTVCGNKQTIQKRTSMHKRRICIEVLFIYFRKVFSNISFKDV